MKTKRRLEVWRFVMSLVAFEFSTQLASVQDQPPARLPPVTVTETKPQPKKLREDLPIGSSQQPAVRPESGATPVWRCVLETI